MASLPWSLLTASVLAVVVVSSCAAAAPELPHPQAWAGVRQSYAARPGAHAAWQGAYGGGAIPIEAERAFDEEGQRDEWAWQNARRRDEADEYERYLREHRDGAYRLEAQRRLDQLRAGDEADWSRADLRDTIEAYQYYIANNPEGFYRDRASQRIRELRDRQLMRQLHRPRPTGMEAQPQRSPAPLPRAAPPATQPLTERVRPAPLERARIAPPAPVQTPAPAIAPLTRVTPPAPPARATPAPAARPPAAVVAPAPAARPFSGRPASEESPPAPNPRLGRTTQPR